MAPILRDQPEDDQARCPHPEKTQVEAHFNALVEGRRRKESKARGNAEGVVLEVEASLAEGTDLVFEEVVERVYGQVEDCPCGVHGVLGVLRQLAANRDLVEDGVHVGGLGRLAVSKSAAA